MELLMKKLKKYIIAISFATYGWCDGKKLREKYYKTIGTVIYISRWY